jgi:hypothetical protein
MYCPVRLLHWALFAPAPRNGGKRLIKEEITEKPQEPAVWGQDLAVSHQNLLEGGRNEGARAESSGNDPAQALLPRLRAALEFNLLRI